MVQSEDFVFVLKLIGDTHIHSLWQSRHDCFTNAQLTHGGCIHGLMSQVYRGEMNIKFSIQIVWIENKWIIWIVWVCYFL